jgi:hypothetical protein
MERLPMMRARPANLPARPVQPRVIVGFDSEWVVDGPRNRMLSYQLVVLNAAAGKRSESYFPLDGATSRRPKKLGWLLAHALRKAIAERVIKSYPDKLILAGHFTRADVSALEDFDEIKTRLTALRKTYATTTIPISVTIATPRGARKVSVTVADTMLLAPAKTKLEKLGADLGVPKIELPEGYTKDRMDLFQADRPDEFRAYAMTDAVIAALWADRVCEILSGLGIRKPVATLAAAAVELVKQEIVKHIDLNTYLGKDKSRRGTPRVKPNLVEIWPFAAQCYHGGLNSVFSYGFSPEGAELVDVDIVSAYTTSLAMAQIPDWSTARRTTDLRELAVVDEAMTFVHARFKFPATVNRPCLPVRASAARGLVYPLTGETWCGGAELVVALGLGAEIEALAGWRVDWTASAGRPLEGFTKTINRLRAEAKAAGDAVREKTVKQVGNSAYGKIGQAVAAMRVIKDDIVHRKTFNTKWSETENLGPSRVSQPMIAAFTTSIVRGVLCEAVGRLPPSKWLGTVTTDGMLFAGSRDDLDESGPVAAAFKAARSRITPDNPAMWEIKHTIPRALVTKTRGTYTVAPPDWPGTPVLARAGFRLPADQGDGLGPLQECARWIEMFRARDYETVVEQRYLTSLREQHVNGKALQEVVRQVRWNADPDLKNEPTNVRDEDGLFAADTVPWSTIGEFEDARDVLDAFRKALRRVIRTKQDYIDMQTRGAGQTSRRAVNARAHGKLPPLARAVVLAALHGACGVSRIGGNAGRGTRATPTYDAFASTLSRLTGIPITNTDIKHVKHRGGDPEKLRGCIAHFTSADVDFAVNLLIGSSLSAIDCLSALCGGESATRQLADAYGRACNALGEEELEPAPENFPEPVAGIPAFALTFVPSEFPDDSATLDGGERDASGAEIDRKGTEENRCRILQKAPQTLNTGLHGEFIGTGVQDKRHLPSISETYAAADGANPPPQNLIGSVCGIMAQGEKRNQFPEAAQAAPAAASRDAQAPPLPPSLGVSETADNPPAPSAACAELGLSPTSGREGEKLMATIVELSEVAFRSRTAKRVVAESLGLSVAELRAEIAAAIVPRIKASGVSPSAARKRAAEIAFDKPGLMVAAMLTRYSPTSVLSALQAAARDGGIVQ